MLLRCIYPLARSLKKNQTITYSHLCMNFAISLEKKTILDAPFSSPVSISLCFHLLLYLSKIANTVVFFFFLFLICIGTHGL
ncbi:hypothetical protein BDV23DRAFT_162779 [Aspergillus alliaceus]|uniref:Uncharacterized protein n=1 Tax=Petromyces alliaceus TaxID=209559 RepID=A0A5N7BXT9_PETAA|nr:hypothetical protein BDV23DRAFT_162779 [Aspergillus alliaceus]